jgi:hypothetical protein
LYRLFFVQAVHNEEVYKHHNDPIVIIHFTFNFHVKSHDAQLIHFLMLFAISFY